ncbi:hypothetical protein ACWF0M_28990 [Kribbella sp. NPDC055110]
MVTVSLALVLLPIAINVGTGGTAPTFLEPYVTECTPDELAAKVDRRIAERAARTYAGSFRA